MERQVSVTVGGKNYSLLYSVAVLLDMTEKYGNISNALDILNSEDKRESAEAVFWFARKMAEAGELAKRYAGHTPQKIPAEQELGMVISPFEYVELQNAVVSAIGLGYMRDVENKDEIDLGLMELEEKKTKDEARAHTIPIPQ